MRVFGANILLVVFLLGADAAFAVGYVNGEPSPSNALTSQETLRRIAYCQDTLQRIGTFHKLYSAMGPAAWTQASYSANILTRRLVPPKDREKYADAVKTGTADPGILYRAGGYIRNEILPHLNARKNGDVYNDELEMNPWYTHAVVGDWITSAKQSEAYKQFLLRGVENDYSNEKSKTFDLLHLMGESLEDLRFQLPDDLLRTPSLWQDPHHWERTNLGYWHTSAEVMMGRFLREVGPTAIEFILARLRAPLTKNAEQIFFNTLQLAEVFILTHPMYTSVLIPDLIRLSTDTSGKIQSKAVELLYDFDLAWRTRAEYQQQADSRYSSKPIKPHPFFEHRAAAEKAIADAKVRLAQDFSDYKTELPLRLLAPVLDLQFASVSLFPLRIMNRAENLARFQNAGAISVVSPPENAFFIAHHNLVMLSKEKAKIAIDFMNLLDEKIKATND